MNLSNIWTLIKQIIDVCFVWIVIYYLLKNIRKNVKFSLLLKGIVLILIIKFISDKFGLVTIGLLFEYVIT